MKKPPPKQKDALVLRKTKRQLKLEEKKKEVEVEVDIKKGVKHIQIDSNGAEIIGNS